MSPVGNSRVKITKRRGQMENTRHLFLAMIELQRELLSQAQFYQWSWETHSRWGLLWLLGGIVMLLVFWGVFFIGLFVVLRWLLGKGRRKAPDKALEILRQRYARGELTKEDFEAIKKDLR